jgi:cyanate lyase
MADGLGIGNQEEGVMTRDEPTRKILTSKRAKGFELDNDRRRDRRRLDGQCDRGAAGADEVALLGLGAEERSLLQEIPYRGSLAGSVPTDPLIYRFYELV